MSAIPSNSTALVFQLKQHFTEPKFDTHFDTNSAQFEVMINDRLVPIKISKMGLQEMIQDLKIDQIQALADHLIAGIEQVKVSMGTQNITHQIDIDLDASTIRINNGKSFKITPLKTNEHLDSAEAKETRDEVAEAKNVVRAKISTKVTAASSIEQEKKAITKNKDHLEKALKELATVYVENAHDKQHERVKNQRAEIEHKIEELNKHLERVQEELDQVSIEVDKDRKELAGLEQTSLLIDIFSQVQKDNFEGFFGIPSTDNIRVKQ